MSRSPFPWWFVVPLFTLLMLPTAHLAAQSESPPGRSTPNRTACQGCVAALYVTPTPSPVFEAPGSVNRTATFVVENQYAYDVEVWNPTCTRTGRVTSCGTISPTSLYLASGQYATITVRYNVSSTTGAGTLTLTVVHDGAGGATQRAGTLSVTVQATGAPTLALRNRPDQLERGLCLTTGAGPGALQCGDLLVAQGLPAYRTLGRDRALTLVYNSATAAPRPTVAALVTNPENSAPASSLYAELKVGASGGAQTLVASGTFAPFGGGQLTEARQIVLGFDAATYASGIYDYTLEVRNLYPNAPFTSRTLTGQLLVMNDRTSRFGRGWSLAGVERIFLWGPNMLWRGAGGTARIYVPVAGQSGTWVAPKAAFRDTLYWRAGLGLYERRLRHGVVVQYDPCGRQTATISRTQQTTSFTWAGAGCGDSLTAITVPPAGSGGTYTITYTNGVLGSISDPTGRVLTATVHPTSRQLTALRDPDNVTTQYGYDAADRLITHQGRTGYPTRYEYAGGLRVTKVITPYGPTTGADSAVSTIEPWDQRGLALGVGATGLTGADTLSVRTRLDGPRAGAADTAAIRVDGWGAPSAIVDAFGATTRIWRTDTVYYPALVTRMRQPNGREVRQIYDAAAGRANLVMIRDSASHLPDGYATRVTQFFYDSTTVPDSPTRVIDPTMRIMRYEYLSSLGLLSAVVDLRQHRTEYAYHTTAPLTGLLMQVNERSVQTWREQAGSVDDSLVTDAVVDHLTRLGYDAKGNLDSVASPAGLVTSSLNDAQGRAYRTWDALNTLTESSFDVMNRVTQQAQYTAPQPNAFGLMWANAGCDATQVSCADSTAIDSIAGAPATLATVYRYGAVALDSVRGPGDPHATKRGYRYDRAGQVIQELDEFGLSDKTYYGATGQVDSTVSRTGDVVRFFYDPAGRLLQRVHPTVTYGSSPNTRTVPGETVSYTYDATTGWLVEARGRNSIVARSYFPDGALKRRIATSLVTTGQPADTLQFTYDASGRRLTMLHGADQVTYTYGGTTGDLATMTVLFGPNGPAASRTFQFAWDTLGRRRQITYPNGAVVQYRYDMQGIARRIKGTFDSTATSARHLRFKYHVDDVDAVGRIRRAGTFGCPAATGPVYGRPCSDSPTAALFRYNRRGMLLSGPSGPLHTDSMRYDAAGSLIKRYRGLDQAWTTFSLQLNSTRLASSQTPSSLTQFANDARGARLSEVGPEPRQYYYDALGRSSGLRYPVMISGSSYGLHDDPDSCRYDADGNLLRTCDGVTADLFYDGPNVVAAWNVMRWMVVQAPGLDEPLYMYGRWCPTSSNCASNAREVYVVTDGQGRQLAVGGPPDNMYADMLPGGQQGYEGWLQAGGTSQSFGFAASRQSPRGSEVSLFRNRMYDQRTGRWTQEDPIGIAGGVNLYQFNGNNPVSYTDPFGLCPLPLATVCARAIVLAVTRIVPAVISAGNALADLHMPGVGGRHGGAPHRALVRALGEAIEEAGEGAAKITAGAGVLPERAVRVGGGRIRFPDITIEAADGSKAYINVGRTRADGTMVKREREAFDDLTGTGVPTFFVPYTR